MDVHDIVSISQGRLAIMNPTTPAKVKRIGAAAGLGEHSRVVEFGSGNGTILALWAEEFGISGTGIEIREEACRTARATLEAGGYIDRIEILCTDAAVCPSGEGQFDLAVCLGASHIWESVEAAVAAMSTFVHERGSIVLGERYWKSERIPPEFSREWQEIRTEYELLCIFREAGFDLAAVIRASGDDWDSYETGIWQECLAWLHSNPGHPDYDDVEIYLARIQEEYLAFGREHTGWAMYLLAPHPEQSLEADI